MPIAKTEGAQPVLFVKKEFGQLLRTERMAKGLSLTDLAQRLTVTKGYISRLELGKAKPSLRIIERTAAVLNLDPTPFCMLAGYLPVDVKQIFYRHPMEAPEVLRETFGEYRGNEELFEQRAKKQQTGPTISNDTLTSGNQTARYETIHADCFEWLDQRTANTIHAIVTDPPYGLKEYTAEEKNKLRRRHGGVWRIPPSFDGCQRSPLPRFTVLTIDDKLELRSFFTEWGKKVFRVLVPGGHVFIATNPLVSHLVYLALEEAGLEKRGEIIRLVQTLRGGDRPKNAHKEFDGVTVMPRSCWEPWGLFRKPCEGRVQDNLRKWKAGGLRRVSDEQPFADVIKSSPTRGIEREIAPHPSLKPQAFMRQVVRAALPLGEGVILDPFMGGGSTIAAACAIGYRSIGVESDFEYYQMAQQAIFQLAALPLNGDDSAVSFYRKELKDNPQPRLFD
ncbi:MAG: helix-turn-helix domain-containing protein [Deltaproteobacteria bacterium]|nr:helix-turn-helix domain-containing protein [Deltaproteobacteria bacterium]